jgi:hypothetical protein
MLPPDMVDALGTLGFDSEFIAQIQAFCDDSATAINGSVPHGVAHRSFGSAPASLGCVADANLARDKVREALVDMVAGFDSWQTGLGKFVSDVGTVEDQTATALATIQQGTDCIDTPTVSSGGVCTVPGADG